MSFNRRNAAPTQIMYNRANGLFSISSSVGVASVTESKLRSIGDMDVTETMEAAMRNPYTPFTFAARRK